MKNFKRNTKRIFWESKTKQVWLVVSSFMFVAIAFWTKENSTPLMFWAGVIFFGSSGLFMLYRFLNPRNLFVDPDSQLGRQIHAEQFQNRQEESGFFSYNDTGFTLREHKGVIDHNWSDIETVFGFKEDWLTTDEICMDIFFSDKEAIRLTESTPGWYQFNKRLSRSIPAIPENWDFEIMLPAFATNLTLLFDKRGRTKEQAERACYNK